MDTFHEMMPITIKLQLSLSVKDRADRSSVSAATVFCTIEKWLVVLDLVLIVK